MTEDVTLDSFDGPAADRAGVTVRWAPDGRRCPSCADLVERLWRDGDGFRCAACTDWAREPA